MADRTVVNVPSLPTPGIPAVRAIKSAGLVFVSGTPAPRKADGTMDPDIRVQVRTCLETIDTILKDAGTSLANAVSVTTFLKDVSDFAAYNEEYRKFWPVDPPTRTTVKADMVLDDMLVEITIIAAQG